VEEDDEEYAGSSYSPPADGQRGTICGLEGTLSLVRSFLPTFPFIHLAERKEELKQVTPPSSWPRAPRGIGLLKSSPWQLSPPPPSSRQRPPWAGGRPGQRASTLRGGRARTVDDDDDDGRAGEGMRECGGAVDGRRRRELSPSQFDSLPSSVRGITGLRGALRRRRRRRTKPRWRPRRRQRRRRQSLAGKFSAVGDSLAWRRGGKGGEKEGRELYFVLARRREDRV